MSDNLRMKELQCLERPYEKLEQLGPRALTDAELIAIQIQSGVAGKSALEIANQLLANLSGLCGLSEASLEEMCQTPGVGRVRAIRLKSAFEIGNRHLSARREEIRPLLQKPSDILQLMEPELRYLSREEFHILMFDVRQRMIRRCKISGGGLAATVVFPRDIFREAVKANAASIALVHNHPSGDAEPSPADLKSTKNLVEAGKMMGIPVIDHLIIGCEGSVSMKERGLI
ncbi:MAG TPA: DNA repair protein RadC [Clostridiaceae bacterium]|nr:DNA repair protein RadC [Clostridiaceae bacterium]